MSLFLGTSVFDQWCGCWNCVFVPFSVEACYKINGNFAISNLFLILWFIVRWCL